MLTFKEFLSESITRIIKDAVPKFMKDENYKKVREINYWSCADFAGEVMRRAKAAGVKGVRMKQSPGMSGHAWIYHNGKHYDAEHPRGVKDSKNLNFFKRERKGTNNKWNLR